MKLSSMMVMLLQTEWLVELEEWEEGRISSRLRTLDQWQPSTNDCCSSNDS